MFAWFRRWRYDRLWGKVAYRATYLVMERAEAQAGHELTPEEVRVIGQQFVEWLERENKIDALLDNPDREINLFLTDVYGGLTPQAFTD
jgi:hypothetical protein